MKENLKKVLEELMAESKDFSVQSDNTEICIYTENGFALVLQDNNKWRLE